MKLKFAELAIRAAGERTFNILINNVTVDAAFDIVATAGNRLKAIDRSYNITVSTGQIIVRFNSIIDPAQVNALEIAAVSPPPYSVSGQVTSGGTGLSGVTMTLSGTATLTATTDASGNYTITGAPTGNYTLTPAKTGYVFSPVSTTG